MTTPAPKRSLRGSARSEGSDQSRPVASRRFRREGKRIVQSLEIDGRTIESSVGDNGTDAADLGGWWHAYLRGERPVCDADANATPVRAVELFCGPGGLALGVRQATAELGRSFIVEAAIDLDPEAVEVYRVNHRSRRNLAASVSTIVDYRIKGTRDEARFVYAPELFHAQLCELEGSIDIVLAGPPCQGHSNLNNRTRRTDRRNELYLEVPAVAVALGAEAIVIENVPAVVHDELGVVDTTVRLLEDAGYLVERATLHAGMMGWPQTRSRFFLVARKNRPPLSLGALERALSDEPRSVAWAFEGLGSPDLRHFMTRAPELSKENRRRIDWLFDNSAYDLDCAERPDCHKDGTTYQAVYGRMYSDRPAQTITTGFVTPGRGRYIHPTERRVITAREAARLQGFPDTYVFQAERDVAPSMKSLTKWIGDAVPMPLGYAAALAVIDPVGARETSTLR